MSAMPARPPSRKPPPVPAWRRIENPILRRELLTMLRTERAFALALICVTTLSLLIYFAWPKEDQTYTTSSLTNLAQSIFELFARGAMVLIALLAPSFAASGVTLEREQETIDLLKASPVPAGTVLWGKLASSVVYLMLLILATAPLVSICLRLPGIEPGQVLGLYLVLLAEALLFGMVGLLCSTIFSRTFAALVTSYFIILPVGSLLLAASMINGFFRLESGLAVAAPGCVVALILYNVAKARYRRPEDAPPAPASGEEDSTRQAGLVIMRRRFPDNVLCPARPPGLWPDGINPIYFKELQHEVLGRGSLFLRVIIQISMLLSLFALPLLYRGGEVYFVWYLVIFIMMVAPSFSAGTFTGEKERGTVEMLMTTLVTPGRLIQGKLLAGLRCTGVLVGMLSLSLVLGSLFSGSFGPVEAFRAELWGYLLLLAVTVLTATTVGMFWSLFSRSTLAATVFTYATLIGLFLVPVVIHMIMKQWLFGAYAEGVPAQVRERWLLGFALSPIEVADRLNLWNAGAERNAEASASAAIQGLACYCGFYLLAVGLLLGWMRIRFMRVLKIY